VHQTGQNLVAGGDASADGRPLDIFVSMSAKYTVENIRINDEVEEHRITDHQIDEHQ